MANTTKGFVFFPKSVIPDNTLVAVASGDVFDLDVLSSHILVCWSRTTGGTFVDRPLYNNSVRIAALPFPNASTNQRATIHDLCEKLDNHRPKQQDLHLCHTLTGMYNVLEAWRSVRALTRQEKHSRTIGLVSVSRKFHDDLDTAVAEAYGWHVDLPDNEIPSRLIALKAECDEEERNDMVRWLRPEVQTETKNKQRGFQARIGSDSQTAATKTTHYEARFPDEKLPWPSDLLRQIHAVHSIVNTLCYISVAINTAPVAEQVVRAPRGRVVEMLRSLVCSSIS